jgi:hypothetical protein
MLLLCGRLAGFVLVLLLLLLLVLLLLLLLVLPLLLLLLLLVLSHDTRPTALFASDVLLPQGASRFLM